MPRQTQQPFKLTTKFVFTKISHPKVLHTYCPLYIIGAVALIEKLESPCNVNILHTTLPPLRPHNRPRILPHSSLQRHLPLHLHPSHHLLPLIIPIPIPKSILLLLTRINRRLTPPKPNKPPKPSSLRHQIHRISIPIPISAFTSIMIHPSRDTSRIPKRARNRRPDLVIVPRQIVQLVRCQEVVGEEGAWEIRMLEAGYAGDEGVEGGAEVGDEGFDG